MITEQFVEELKKYKSKGYTPAQVYDEFFRQNIIDPNELKEAIIIAYKLDEQPNIKTNYNQINNEKPNNFLQKISKIPPKLILIILAVIILIIIIGVGGFYFFSNDNNDSISSSNSQNFSSAQNEQNQSSDYSNKKLDPKNTNPKPQNSSNDTNTEDESNKNSNINTDTNTTSLNITNSTSLNMTNTTSLNLTNTTTLNITNSTFNNSSNTTIENSTNTISQDSLTNTTSNNTTNTTTTNNLSPEETFGCDNLSLKLDSCENYLCEFEHPLMGGLYEKEIIGLIDNKCHYTEEMPNNGSMNCEFNESLRKAVAQYYSDFFSDNVQETYLVGDKEVENPLQEALDLGECEISGYEEPPIQNNNETNEVDSADINLEVRIPKESYQVGESLNNSNYFFEYIGEPFQGVFLFYKTTQGLAEGSCNSWGDNITSDGIYNLDNWGFLENENLECDGNYVYSIAVFDSKTIDSVLGDEDFGFERCETIWQRVSPVKVASKMINVSCPDETIDCCENWVYRCDDYTSECIDGYECVNYECIEE